MNKPRNDLSLKVQEHFSGGKVTVTFFRTPERRARGPALQRGKEAVYVGLLLDRSGAF